MPEVSEKLHARPGRAASPAAASSSTTSRPAIGKRYARMDEAGCPYCFTIDGETLKDQTVTVRDRDTGQQERIAIDRAVSYLSEKLGL